MVTMTKTGDSVLSEILCSVISGGGLNLYNETMRNMDIIRRVQAIRLIGVMTEDLINCGFD